VPAQMYSHPTEDSGDGSE